MYKACLLGASFDTGNMGVSALAVSFFTIVKTLRGEAQLYLLAWRSAPGFHDLKIGGARCRINIVNCRMSPRSELQQHIVWVLLLAMIFRCVPLGVLRRHILNANLWLRTVHDADFIGSIHGGDSFSDIYGLKRLIYVLLPDLSVLLMGKRLALLPQTYGPYKSRAARWLAKLVLRKSGPVLSRDKASIDTVRELLRGGAGSKQAVFCPDVAFMLPQSPANDSRIEPSLPEKLDLPLVGLNVSGLLYNGGYGRDNMFGLKLDYRELVEAVIRRLLANTSVHIFLLPHTFAPPGDVESDPYACSAVQQKVSPSYPGRVHMLASEHGPSELKGLISRCEFFIGSRMHACIGALSQSIPTVGIAYSRKFAGVFESVRDGALVVDARSVDLNEALNAIMRHFAERQRHSECLGSSLPVLQLGLTETFQLMVAPGNKTFSPSVSQIQ